MVENKTKRVAERPDDFETRRAHLAGLSDEEIERRFWELADKIVEPLIELAKTHTSPSIERSVVLRMGFSSIEAKEIVSRCANAGLLGKGAGHCILKYAEAKGISIRDAGLALMEDGPWAEIKALFGLAGSGAEGGQA